MEATSRSKLFFFFVFLFSSIFVIQPRTSLAGLVDENGLELSPGQQYGLRVGLWTVEDAPEGLEEPFIRLKLNISREDTNSSGKIDLLTFHSSDSSYIGFVNEEHQKSLCCSKELYEYGKCSVVGDLILSENLESTTFVHLPIHFEKGESWKSKNEMYQPIPKSGIYYVYLVNCEDANVGHISVKGNIIWRNPYGHLSGDQFYFLSFYGRLCVIYMILGLIWFVLSAIHYDKLLVIQNWIAGVIGLGMIETATWYFEYYNYNLTGDYHLGAIVVGILVSTFKRTVSRLLVLVVAMGFGVVKANLGDAKSKVLTLGALYFFFSGSFQILSNNAAAEGLTTLLVIPVALLDTFFYWWIFLSLVRTITQLIYRKQSIKLEMYKRLFITLVLSGLASALVVIYQLYAVLTSSVDDRWETWWIWESFWHVLYFLVLLVICILWRPTENNLRYAFAELKEVEESLTAQPLLTALYEMTQRSSRVEDEEEAPKPVPKIETKPEPPKIVPNFTLEEDEESQTEASKMN